ncbi:MAG TPA: hypothetical protein VGH87_18190, partial [Polyangiaceae bacterium]
MTDELSEIQSLLMSDDHTTGRERLAAWLESLDAEPIAARELALRDLGAPESAAYAHVAAGDDVVVLAATGERASPPSPDGRRWAYV